MASKFDKLQELIRLASNSLLTKEDKFKYLEDPNLKKALYQKFPECFISIKKMGRDTGTYILPLCNRAGFIDTDVMKISIEVVTRLMSDPTGSYDVNELTTILDKLNRLRRRYEKEVPKPAEEAGRKAVVTRMFNNIRQHLMVIGSKNDNDWTNN
jgi:hypothetical protein